MLDIWQAVSYMSAFVQKALMLLCFVIYMTLNICWLYCAGEPAAVVCIWSWSLCTTVLSLLMCVVDINNNNLETDILPFAIVLHQTVWMAPLRRQFSIYDFAGFIMSVLTVQYFTIPLCSIVILYSASYVWLIDT